VTEGGGAVVRADVQRCASKRHTGAVHNCGRFRGDEVSDCKKDEDCKKITEILDIVRARVVEGIEKAQKDVPLLFRKTRYDEMPQFEARMFKSKIKDDPRKIIVFGKDGDRKKEKPVNKCRVTYPDGTLESLTNEDMENIERKWAAFYANRPLGRVYFAYEKAGLDRGSMEFEYTGSSKGRTGTYYRYCCVCSTVRKGVRQNNGDTFSYTHSCSLEGKLTGCEYCDKVFKSGYSEARRRLLQQLNVPLYSEDRYVQLLRRLDVPRYA